MKRKNMTTLLAALVLAFSSVMSVKTFAHKSFQNLISSKLEVLFIQIAKEGELKPNADQTYQLVLKNVDPFTSFFTDRPNRATGFVPTKKFVSLWQNDDIKNSPPNVAIESSNALNGQRINRILVLSNPIYDTQKHQISYTAKLLGEPLPINHPVKIGYTVLFIDDFHWNGNRFGGG